MSYPTALDIATGASGWFSGNKFGRNSSVGTAFTPVSRGGVYQMPKVGGARTLRVRAGNAADVYGGAGAWSVTVVGLDESGYEITETLRCNGAAAGLSGTKKFVRVYRAYVAESGTYATTGVFSHVGEIIVEDTTSFAIWISISATLMGRGQSQVSSFSVPLQFEIYILSATLSVEATKSATITLVKRDNILQTSAPYSAMRVQEEFVGVTGFVPLDFPVPLGPFRPLTDVGFMARVSAQTGDVSVSFNYAARRVA